MQDRRDRAGKERLPKRNPFGNLISWVQRVQRPKISNHLPRAAAGGRAARKDARSPENAAISKISTVMPYLTANSTYSNALLSRVLLTHMLATNLSVIQVPEIATQVATLLKGQNVTVQRNVTAVTMATNAGKSSVILADVAASNDLAHVIDSVLLPETCLSRLPGSHGRTNESSILSTLTFCPSGTASTRSSRPTS